MPGQKIDWKKLVSESNGQMVYLPDLFVDEAQKVETLRKDYNKEVVKMSEMEIGMNIMTQNMFYALRKYFAKNGIADIWTQDMGFNTDALKDGVFIVNIREQGKQL